MPAAIMVHLDPWDKLWRGYTGKLGNGSSLLQLQRLHQRRKSLLTGDNCQRSVSYPFLPG